MTISDITVIISASAAAFTAIGAILQGAYIQYSKNRQQRFENYHDLIEKINAPRNVSDTIYSQVQNVALFELRNYKEHKDVSKQILMYWRKNEKYKSTATDTLEKLGFKDVSE